MTHNLKIALMMRKSSKYHFDGVGIALFSTEYSVEIDQGLLTHLTVLLGNDYPAENGSKIISVTKIFRLMKWF